MGKCLEDAGGVLSLLSLIYILWYHLILPYKRNFGSITDHVLHDEVNSSSVPPSFPVGRISVKTKGALRIRSSAPTCLKNWLFQMVFVKKKKY